MSSEILYNLTIGLIEQLTGLVETCISFLFSTLDLGVIKLSMWQFLAGAGFFILMVAYLVKKFVPLT